EVPLEDGHLGLTPEEVIKRCDENTIGVVPTLGVTFTCQYEPVKEIAQALDKLEQDTGLNIPIHVDAASGGFLAPFCAPELEWDSVFHAYIPSIPRGINLVWHHLGWAG